jgi:hypothetical protein
MKKKTFKRQATIFGLSALGAGLLGLGCGFYNNYKTPVLTAEIPIVSCGENLPAPDVWFAKLHADAEFIQAPSTALPGEFPVTIQVGNDTFNTSVKIVDKTPPTATPLTLCHGVYGVNSAFSIPPENFVSNIVDVSPVTVTYQTPPNLSKTGTSEVKLLLTDSEGNKSNLTANLEILPVKGYLEFQTMEKDTVTVEDFKTDNSDVQVALLTEIPKEWLEKVGEHEIKLNVTQNGKTKEVVSTLVIKDTIAPTATAKNPQIWLGKELIPTDFLENISDNSDTSKITFEFEKDPDFTLEGNQNVNIILTDENGNKATVNSTLTITKDSEKPVITPVKELFAAVGEKITYRSAVTVTDNLTTPPTDGSANPSANASTPTTPTSKVTLDVDSSAVDVNTPGTYPVLYTATDESGNVATLELNITISDVTEEMLLEEVDWLISRIIREDMTDPEKVEAIQRWVRGNVYYIDDGSKKSEYIEAYHGFTQLSGDCYTFYACSKVLLDRVGIENKMAQRIAGQPTTHYWNMWKFGEEWYHMDSCPYLAGFPAAGHMMTDEDLKVLTAERGREYYTYR